MGITIFTPAAYPVDEYHRSAAAYALLAHSVDLGLSTIAHDVREIFGMAWSGICVVAGEVQHVIASSEGMLGMYKRSTALSGYVVADPGRVFVVPDARQDNRFAGNPFVADGLIRFFAGAAIFDHAGHALGALCITDRTPHDGFNDDDQTMLTGLAARVTVVISNGKTDGRR